MMAGCICMDRECANICALALQEMQSNSPFVKNKFAICVQKFAKHVGRNAGNTAMTIVKNAPKHACAVRKLAGKWPDTKPVLLSKREPVFGKINKTGMMCLSLSERKKIKIGSPV